MKKKTKFALLASLSAATMTLGLVIEKNVEHRDELVQAATSELEAVEVQRRQTQQVIDFMTNNMRFAIIEADRDRNILSARGDLDSIGWTRGGLVGASVDELLPEAIRFKHSCSYASRVDAGKSGKVRLFTNERGRQESGLMASFDGLVLWHAERQVAIAFISPSVIE